uniref:Uncharacterized protein n=1 Tax=Pyxicephalus adspersus TaxID=30357 RepID=A0AAV3AMT6_PYXAD|nr:TPA: hypothetical protein GDO54_010111 [Pyxicephalus adspersus]
MLPLPTPFMYKKHFLSLWHNTTYHKWNSMNFLSIYHKIKKKCMWYRRNTAGKESTQSHIDNHMVTHILPISQRAVGSMA